MNLYETTESFRSSMTLLEASLWVMAANVAMFAVAVIAGSMLVKHFAANRIGAKPPKLTTIELVLAVICVALNGGVAVVGLMMWRDGTINLRPYGDYGALTVVMDTIVLFVAMDFLMYVFHRVAHLPLFYPIAHATHHHYNNPQPISLFVLHPAEVIGFGGLWLLVLLAYTSSIEGILIYLTLNLVFGLVGHLGVEPMPSRWVRLPLVRFVSTSTFHAEHHMDRGYNFGFYLLVWDRLFGTLSPEYVEDFSRATEPASVAG